MVWGKPDTHAKEQNWAFMLPHTKITSTWIEDLNVAPETIKLLEEHIREKLHNIGVGSDFLDMMPKVQTTKAKLDKWDSIKLKSFYFGKKIIKKMRRQPNQRVILYTILLL